MWEKRLIECVKAALRPTPIGYIWRRLHRSDRSAPPPWISKAAEQENSYLAVRERTYRQLPNVFGPPGYLAKSATLLQQRWNGPWAVKRETKNVRLFLLDRPAWVGPWMQSELDHHFDAILFSYTRHWQGFLEGHTDLVSYSLGLNEANRSLRYELRRARDKVKPWRAQLQEDILTAVSKAHSERPIDLCFVYGSYIELAPETLKAIRGIGIPVALWWLDEKHAFWGDSEDTPGGQEPLIGSADVHVTNSLEAVRWYMAEGIAAYFMPQGIDTDFYSPRNVEKDIPVSFVGQAYGYRHDFIRFLREAGIPVQCFGRGWEQEADDAIDIFRRTRINLGLGGTGWSPRLTCIKGRDFEVSSTGGLYLTTYNPELIHLFEIGREILCYWNEIDCVEQIRYYLDRTEEVERIARAGRTRCLREHTWTHRFVGLLRWMGILESEPAFQDPDRTIPMKQET